MGTVLADKFRTKSDYSIPAAERKTSAATSMFSIWTLALSFGFGVFASLLSTAVLFNPNFNARNDDPLMQKLREENASLASQLANQVAETERLIASAPRRITDGTLYVVFAPISPADPDRAIRSFAFSRSSVPEVGDKITADFTLAVFGSFPSRSQANSPSWKNANELGIIDDGVPLLVRNVKPISGYFWIEACIAANSDCKV